FYGLTSVRRHDIVLRDRCPRRGNTDHLPDAALRASLPRMSSRPEGMPRHRTPAFLLPAEVKERDASRLIASETSRILKSGMSRKALCFGTQRPKGRSDATVRVLEHSHGFFVDTRFGFVNDYFSP